MKYPLNYKKVFRTFVVHIKMEKTQWKTTLMCVSAYRTVLTETVCVPTRTTPVELIEKDYSTAVYIKQ